jgi:fumarate reductase flavoprotein subunit
LSRCEITKIWRNVVQTFQADLAVIGAGGAGLRAAIAAAQANPNAKIALISKVYPMRSHTVAAEGGSAAVAQDHDSFEYHFHDTVAGGDWLCEQDVVDYFVHHCPTEMTQLEQWGCPWSRRPDGSVNVRRFGGMKIERTWFAADKTGFHMLHTLFQTSLQFPQIQRFDEHFVLDILVDDGHARGLVAMNMMEGTLVQIRANAVVMATGGAGRVYRYNTNGGIVTGDGMGMALSHGVPLRDMEFVQYHPTGLPGSGILMTEGCRGEGGILVNKNGYRYLQDYGMGPETPLGEPKNKYMELGPRDKVSQAFLARVAQRQHHLHTARRRGSPRPASPGREKAAGTSAVHLRAGESLRRRRSGERADSGPPNGALHHGRDRNRPAVRNPY